MFSGAGVGFGEFWKLCALFRVSGFLPCVGTGLLALGLGGGISLFTNSLAASCLLISLSLARVT